MVEQVWNYSFSVPSALLLATLLAFYFSKPRLDIRLNRAFLLLLVMQLLVMAIDVASSLADEHYRNFTPEALWILNTLFFMLFIARIFAFFVMTVQILHVADIRFVLMASLPALLCEVLSLFSFANGYVFRIVNGMYQAGPAYGSIYACFAFYIALSVILAVQQRRNLDKRHFATVLGFNAVLLAGIVVRYLFPYMLVMNTFCLVAIVVIYLAFVNPDFYLAPRVNAFNTRGLREALADRTERDDCCLLGFALKNYHYERGVLGDEQMDVAVNHMVKFLGESVPRMQTFYLGDGRFALVGPKSVDAQKVHATIRDRYLSPWQTGRLSIMFAIAFVALDPNPGPDSKQRIMGSLFIAFDEAMESVGTSADGSAANVSDVTMVDQRVDALRALERALDRDEIEVFLQPLVDATTRKVVAAEALARVRGEDGQIISPELFIPIAEKGGYIDQLGEQVLGKVCAFIRGNDVDALGLGWINVNLSPIQCMHHDIAAQLLGVVNQHGVPVEKIHFEITEQSIIDYDRLETQINALAECGFALSMDDYGSGYSNLSRVKRCPFTNIKLDIELVWGYCRDPDALLPSVVRGFRETGRTVVAEGVETPEMADAMAAMGCDYLQGFLFSKPVPMDEFLQHYGRA